MKVWLKLVPNAEPNADGEWQAFDVDVEELPEKWRQVGDLVDPLIPADRHVVAYDTREPAQ